MCLDEGIKTQYITPKGPRSYPKKWPPKVRMMARMSFLFQFMEPDDLGLEDFHTRARRLGHRSAGPHALHCPVRGALDQVATGRC